MKKTYKRLKLTKVKAYYRIAGPNKDVLQFNSTYSDKLGYVNKTKDMEKDGIELIVVKKI